ncbi:hypothetical protein DYB31_005109, partial [Aphanomyces astaci]
QRQVAEGGFGDEFDVSVYAWLAPKVFATLLDTFYGKGLCTPQLAHDFDLLESKIVALYAGAPATLLKVTEPRQRLHEALREYIEAHTDTAVAHATVDLPNGTQLRMQPGDEIMLWGGLGYHDPSRFHNPDDFQFDRFARYPDLAKDFRPFGLGKFNCPGQFFAVEFLKVALATLMLDTEISQFEGSASPNYTTAGVFAPKDAEAVRMCIRRRVFMADHPTMDETSNGCVSCA